MKKWKERMKERIRAYLYDITAGEENKIWIDCNKCGVSLGSGSGKRKNTNKSSKLNIKEG